MKNNQFDVIIIGGSYAGLSSAMTLGRSLRNVLIIDSGKPCNRFTPHSHNFITQDGAVPGVIAAEAKKQVMKYPTIKWIDGLAVDGKKTANGFDISLQSGETFMSKKLIFASGVKDVFPDIKGFEACWGKSVIHCPYCHGYEVKGAKTAILANGDIAYHYAQLLQNLTDNLTIITNGKADFSSEQLAKFDLHNINILEKKIDHIQQQSGQVQAIVFTDGETHLCDAIYARPDYEQHCQIAEKLGCELTEQGHIKVDMMQKTTINGVFACGDNTSPMRSVAFAVASGNMAGAATNSQLTEAEF